MTQEQAHRLTSWGFVWTSGMKRPEKKTENKSWDVRFQQLLEFKAQHGHTIVPQLHNELGAWVHRQRREYKKKMSGRKYYCLADDKIAKLESIGFVFHAKRSGARGMQFLGDDGNQVAKSQAKFTRKKNRRQDGDEDDEETENDSDYDSSNSDNDDDEDDAPKDIDDQAMSYQNGNRATLNNHNMEYQHHSNAAMHPYHHQQQLHQPVHSNQTNVPPLGRYQNPLAPWDQS
jgi:hypothetical protein